MTLKIAVQNLSLTLPGGETLLHGISLKIPAGQITALIGPSGSGKSTLLRCLNRLWEPPAGSIFLDGHDITSLNVIDLRRRVGLLFQDAALFGGTVSDNIGYGPRLQGKSLTPQQVAELLKMANLEVDLASKSVEGLSGGQAQRVSLARTLANRPEVLLLDEPTSALDPAATQKIEKTILRLKEKLGLTVVWVSHAFEQVGRTADYMALMVEGKVVESGPADHILSGIHHHLIDDFAAGRM